MDLVSPVVGFLNRVWDCTVKCSDPIRHLRENLQSLEEAKRELEAISRDVESNVSLEEQQHSRRTNQVQNWLETVDRTLKEVEDTLHRGDQEIKKRCLGNWCAKNCCSTRNFGKEVIKKLTAVKELVSKGHFDVVADKLPPAAVDVRPMEKTVGTESRFSQLWRYVQDHSMHDVLRDMALWIASEQKNKILVQEYVELSKTKSSMAKWVEAKRISLWRLNVEAFTKSLSCPYLPTTTLFVRDSDLVRFPNNFFRSVCSLIVLDLSKNENLIELPVEIGELVNLQYLNVSFTSIKTLPIEVKKLRLLRILRFEDMLDLQNIPAGVISCLSSLQMFCWFSYSSTEAYHVDISLLQELEGLEHIKDISLMLSSVDCIDKLFSSPKLKACVTSLRIRCPKECSSLVIDISSSAMKRMKILQIIGCKSLKELRFCGTEDDHDMPNNLPSLEFLYLRKCPIKDLTWFIHVPSLLWLTIGECPSLTEVIACDIGFSEIQEAFDIFPNLGRMVLINLPSLKSICRPAMPFPSLKSMWIWDCPNLRNLPFNLETVKTSCLNEISASEEWWHRLEWGNEATKHHFTSKFKQATVLGLGL
ncbi:hypothetical protein EZV62_004080 [Acer yangbiense]|uniref:Disease resistance R13L4/SHOC-2-like LRR domain-containing protein n=1 Tax=Acer yangbiense TaxID=1000413 RepID=A0A5C7IJ78_9ROSI|nr:hypothetical protein EZV62_004080 [Acer yangbiense]